jgi:flagellar assembly protein FliH
MATPRKYLFDQSFDHTNGPVAVRFHRNPTEPTFTRTELEAACAKAREEGHQAALSEAAAAIEGQLAQAAEALVSGLAALAVREDEHMREAEARAIEFLRMVAAKAVPALARKEPLADLEVMVVDCLREAADEPRIVLRVAPDLFEPMRRRLDAIAQGHGFAGKFVLLVDESIGPADGRLEWADGGAERNVARVARDIDAALARALLNPVSESEPSTEETPHE